MAEDKKKEIKMDELESVSGGYGIYHDLKEDPPEMYYGSVTSFRCKSCGNVFNTFYEPGKCPKCNADIDIYNDYA
jgi:rubrerythrin